MSDGIVVDYNKARKRFEIDVPFMMVGIIKRMPMRKWNKAARKWFAPAMRKNAEYISKRLALMSMCSVTDEAQAEIVSILNKANKLCSKAIPEWYEPRMPMRSYQQECADKFYAMNDIGIFACVGSGKTKMAIDIVSAKALSADSSIARVDTVLVICPYSIQDNWLAELNTHCNIPYTAMRLNTKTAVGKREFAAFISVPPDERTNVRFLIVGIESLSTGAAIEHTKKYVASGNTVVIVDELSKIKTPNAKRTANVIALGKAAVARIGLTGTPVTQGLHDLFSQMYFINPEIIGYSDYYSFRNRYCVMGGYDNKQIIGYDNVEELLGCLQPYVFQVTREVALPELPERTYTRRVVELNATQKKLYADIINHQQVAIDASIVTVQNALSKLLRLQQITGGFAVKEVQNNLTGDMDIESEYIGGNKVTELVAVAEELPDQMIIWARFRPELALIADTLRSKFGADSVAEFHGGIDSEGRWNSVERFNRGDARFFVGNQATGGMGLTLTAATVAVYYSNSFSSEDREQSEARNYRLGQNNAVTYIDLICAGTVDEQVTEVLSDKKNVADFVRDSLEAGISPIK